MRTLLLSRGDEFSTFWDVHTEQNVCVVRGGRLGTVGKEQQHVLRNDALAHAWAWRSVAQKKHEGWHEQPTPAAPHEVVPTQDDDFTVESLLADARACLEAGFATGEEYEDSHPDRYALHPRAHFFRSARQIFALAEACDAGARALTAHAEWAERCEYQFGRIASDTAHFYREASKRRPDDLPLLERLALSLQRAGDDTGAIACYDRLIADSPDEALFYFLRALCHRQQRHHQTGLDDVQQAIVLQPLDARFYLLRARLNARVPSPTIDPLRDVQHAVTLCDSAELRRTLGEWLASAGRHAEAVAAYTLALSKDPEDAASYNGRSACLHRLGDLRSAVEDERQYTRLRGQESWEADYRRRDAMWRMLQSKSPPSPDTLLSSAAPSTGSSLPVRAPRAISLGPSAALARRPVTSAPPSDISPLPTETIPDKRAAHSVATPPRPSQPGGSHRPSATPERARQTGRPRPVPPRVSAPRPQPVLPSSDDATPIRARRRNTPSG